MQRELGRTPAALRAKLRRMIGANTLRRGSYSVRQLVAGTGYQPEQFRRAAQALNQKWKRLHPQGPFLITEEQRDELITWLQHDYWAPLYRLYCCLFCTTEVRPHRALGLCERCYASYVRICRAKKMKPSPKAQARGLAYAGTADRLAPSVLARMRRGMAADLDTIAMIAPWLGGGR